MQTFLEKNNRNKAGGRGVLHVGEKRKEFALGDNFVFKFVSKQMGTDLIARNSASRLKATLGLAFVDWVLLLCQLASNVTLRAPWAAGSRDKP